jgi:DNA-directed RNA polymerase specialized sigma24 family protein
VIKRIILMSLLFASGLFAAMEPESVPRKTKRTLDKASYLQLAKDWKEHIEQRGESAKALTNLALAYRYSNQIDAAMKATCKLPEHLRSVIALRISSGMPYAEIGAIVSIPEGTARRRMHQALNQIRTTLGLPGDNKELEDGQQKESGRISRQR